MPGFVITLIAIAGLMAISITSVMRGGVPFGWMIAKGPRVVLVRNSKGKVGRFRSYKCPITGDLMCKVAFGDDVARLVLHDNGNVIILESQWSSFSATGWCWADQPLDQWLTAVRVKCREAGVEPGEDEQIKVGYYRRESVFAYVAGLIEEKNGKQKAG